MTSHNSVYWFLNDIYLLCHLARCLLVWNRRRAFLALHTSAVTAVILRIDLKNFVTANVDQVIDTRAGHTNCCWTELSTFLSNRFKCFSHSVGLIRGQPILSDSIDSIYWPKSGNILRPRKWNGLNTLLSDLMTRPGTSHGSPEN